MVKEYISHIKFLFIKHLVHPIKYGRGGDYDAEQYWNDRFMKHNLNIKSIGIEGLSEEENMRLRQQGEKVFHDLCQDLKIDFSQLKALDVGCGIGYYTNILKELGVREYTGIDITDAYFAELCKTFPSYRFIKKDITSEALEGHFDIVLVMDVVQHIVSETKLSHMLQQIKGSLCPGGRLIIVPVTEHKGRRMFHVRSWALDEIECRLSEDFYIEKKLTRKKGEYLLSIRKETA